MPDPKHEAVVSALENLYRNYQYHGKPYAREIVRNSQSKPLVLLVPQKGGSLTREYYPDLYVIGGRSRKIDVCEVWHSEGEDSGIVDAFYSFLIPDVRFLGIVCTGNNLSKDDAQELIDPLCSYLSEAVIPEKQNELLRDRNYAIAQPDNASLSNPKALEELLRREFQFS
jgi:hypothetical protein